MITEEHALIEEILEGLMSGLSSYEDLSDKQAKMELELNIDQRFGPVVGGCWSCGLEVRQLTPLKPGSNCPFCGKFMKRV